MVFSQPVRIDDDRACTPHPMLWLLIWGPVCKTHCNIGHPLMKSTECDVQIIDGDWTDRLGISNGHRGYMPSFACTRNLKILKSSQTRHHIASVILKAYLRQKIRVYICPNFTEICCWCWTWQLICIEVGNGLAPNRKYASTWHVDDTVNWHL